MEVHLGDQPFDLDFHPSSPLVATGLINDTDMPLMRNYGGSSIPAHAESCRAVRFVHNGQVLLSASPDYSILATDVETGAVIARQDDAHKAAVNRLVTLTETTIASGDDNGCIKVWDTRNRMCCNSFDAHEDYISDMTFISSSLQLLGTSGDGTLSVCSLRKNKLKEIKVMLWASCPLESPPIVQKRSEFSEDELLSLVTMKNGRKVVCGTQSGTLLLYSWGYFADCSDRFLGHPMSVDSLLKLDEDTLISGSGDGVIRLVGILPNRIIQPMCEHSEYPVEGIALSHDRKFLGSISHDQMLKLWDLQELLENQHSAPSKHIMAADSDDGDDDDDDDDMDVDVMSLKPSKGSKRKGGNNGQSSNASASDFFADL